MTNVKRVLFLKKQPFLPKTKRQTRQNEIPEQNLKYLEEGVDNVLRNTDTAVKLFFWAVLAGQSKIAKLFWRFGQVYFILYLLNIFGLVFFLI